MLASKNRNKKICITNTAIEKISKIQVNELTDEQNSKLCKLHKKLLRKSKEENDSNEVLIAWNLYTGETAIVYGDRKSVIIDLLIDVDMAVLRSNAFDYEIAYLHNHPSTSKFSYTDIYTFIDDNKLRLMSVVTNQGEVYIISKNEKYERKSVVALFNETVLKLGGVGVLIDETFFETFVKQAVKQGGLDYETSR
ncbi:hypothetical protein FACS1894111_03900 [Clostridia bacterium]|nr:hypothetical protein FACS1894111_03900 [Clostridia bacterium]